MRHGGRIKQVRDAWGHRFLPDAMAKAGASVGHKLHVVVVGPSGSSAQDLDDEPVLSGDRQVTDGVNGSFDGYSGQAGLGVARAQRVIGPVVLGDPHDVFAGPVGNGERAAQCCGQRCFQGPSDLNCARAVVRFMDDGAVA